VSNRKKSENTAEKRCRWSSRFSTVTGSPSTFTWPASGAYSPAITLARVVLPLPLPPTMKISSPAWISRSIGPRVKVSSASASLP
jgi:hypothetical protein